MTSPTAVAGCEPGADAVKRKRWSRDTKSRIVEAATVLFSTRGYAETTVEQIGAAVGLTGPAIYRHFEGKAALFEAVIVRSRQPAWDETCRLFAEGGDPREILRVSIASWVRQSVERRAIVACYVQQHRNLDDDTRGRIRVAHRELTGIWVELLGRIHPELDLDERTTIADSAMWLLRAPAFFRPTLPPDRLSELLTKMMLAALLVD